MGNAQVGHQPDAGCAGKSIPLREESALRLCVYPQLQLGPHVHE
jgi:hypothetical protein